MSSALSGGFSTIPYQVFLNVLVRHTQWQKPTQYCKAIILQLKIKLEKTRHTNKRMGFNPNTIQGLVTSVKFLGVSG